MEAKQISTWCRGIITI